MKKRKDKLSRGQSAGRAMADALVEFIHLMYQKKTAKRVLTHMIAWLQFRAKEFDR